MARQGATATIERRVQRIIFCYEHARRLLELRSNSTKDEQYSFAEWARISLEYRPTTAACDIYCTINKTFMYYFETCPLCNGTGDWKPENKAIGLPPTCTECNGRGVVMKKKTDFPKAMEHLHDALNYYINASKPRPLREVDKGTAVVGGQDMPEYYFLRQEIKRVPFQLPEHTKITVIPHEPGDLLQIDPKLSSFTFKVSEELRKALTNFNKPDEIIYGGPAGGKTYRFWQILFFMEQNGYDMSRVSIISNGKEMSYAEALKDCPFPH